jgi:putative transcription factor
MNHQDWEKITFKKPETRISQKQNPAGTKEFRVLESEDQLPPKKIDNSTAMAIQQARQAKGLTRKELAIGLNIQASVVADYECGKAIPNRQVLGSIGRFLGVKL